MSLRQLGLRNFTEKANLGFLDIYEEHWDHLMDIGEPITMLEIGVYNGNSIKTWLDYFPRDSLIFGIDNNPQHYVHDISRARLFKGNQTDYEFLKEVVGHTYDGFDIIIDDGGHHWDEQQISFHILWPHVRPGGMYIIEDLQTSMDIHWRGDPAYEHTAGFLGGKASWVMMDAIGEDIASMHIYPRLCILKKRRDNERR